MMRRCCQAVGRKARPDLATIRGTDDDVKARNALVAHSPALYDPWGGGLLFLPRDTVSIQPVGDLLWEGIVRYGTIPATNESVFSFDTGGGAQHIAQSLAIVARYAPAGQTAPNFKGAIGVTADSVEGVDITVPVYHFAETHYLAVAVVTPVYKLTLFVVTGRVNNSAFKGFAAGEWCPLNKPRLRATRVAWQAGAMNKLPAERWRKIIGEQAGSGLSVVAFCRRAKVPPGSFYFWRRKLRDVVTFAEVRVSSAPAGEAREIELRLPGGRCVVVRPGFDRQTLLDLLVTLEHADCVAAESAGGMGGREEEPAR